MITKRISDFRLQIEDPDRFLSTCDGGDVGTPDSPSVWLLGIEPGWSLADQVSDEQADEAAVERYQLYPVDLQLGWPFNRNAFKLLSALSGGDPRDYHAFAERAQPFVRGSKGYFKANLFPVPFNNVDAWSEAAVDETGFATKEAYRSWVRTSRIPVLREWIYRCRPRLVIGCGLTCSDEFLQSVGVSGGGDEHLFEVNGYFKRVVISTNGIVPVAVIPHLSGGPHSLNSFEAIRLAAEIIQKELAI